MGRRSLQGYRQHAWPKVRGRNHPLPTTSSFRYPDVVDNSRAMWRLMGGGWPLSESPVSIPSRECKPASVPGLCHLDSQALRNLHLFGACPVASIVSRGRWRSPWRERGVLFPALVEGGAIPGQSVEFFTVSQLRQMRPHYWPTSVGGGARGASGRRNTEGQIVLRKPSERTTVRRREGRVSRKTGRRHPSRNRRGGDAARASSLGQATGRTRLSVRPGAGTRQTILP